MPVFAEKSSRLPVLLALSGAMHGALVLALTLPINEPKRPVALSALRFSGATFDIEALDPSAGAPLRNLPADLVEPEPASSPSPEGPPEPEETEHDSIAAAEEDQASSEESADPIKTPSAEKTKLTKGEDQPKNASETTKPRAKPLPANAPNTAGSPPADPQHGTSTSASSQAPSGASFGQEGAPAGTVDLLAAYLKTLPLAGKLDSTWTRLPLGQAGTIELSLRIDEQFHLAPVVVHESPDLPAPLHLKKMAMKNRAWLLHGTFALKSQSAKGTQRLRLSAVISEKEADADTPDAPGTRALGTRGGQSPTGAYFTYFSGRHVELTLTRID